MKSEPRTVQNHHNLWQSLPPYFHHYKEDPRVITTLRTPSSDCHLLDAAYQLHASGLASAWYMVARCLAIFWQALPNNCQAGAKHVNYVNCLTFARSVCVRCFVLLGKWLSSIWQASIKHMPSNQHTIDRQHRADGNRLTLEPFSGVRLDPRGPKLVIFLIIIKKNLNTNLHLFCFICADFQAGYAFQLCCFLRYIFVIGQAYLLLSKGANVR